MIDWITSTVEEHLEVERRHDPERLADEAGVRLRVAELLESVAAFVFACDAFAVLFVEEKDRSFWIGFAIVVLIVVGLLVEGWLFREVADALLERASASRIAWRRAFENEDVYLTSQRIMSLRQRGAGNDVCSALLAILRHNGPAPVRMPGGRLLEELEPLLGRARTSETLKEISTALAV